MELSRIKNKNIELFTENEIEVYRRNINIDLSEAIDVYLQSKGFIVFVDKKHEILGYLEKSDSGSLVQLINSKDNLHKSIKVLVEEQKLELKREVLDHNESLLTVLKKLNKAAQIYFPIKKHSYLIGRVSIETLKERLEELY